MIITLADKLAIVNVDARKHQVRWRRNISFAFVYWSLGDRATCTLHAKYGKTKHMQDVRNQQHTPFAVFNNCPPHTHTE